MLTYTCSLKKPREEEFFMFLRDIVNPTRIMWNPMIQNKNQSILYTLTQINYMWFVAGKWTIQFCVFKRFSTFPTWLKHVSDILMQKRLAETTIMFIIFWDFFWLSKFSFHHKWNWYIRVASEVAWLKTLNYCLVLSAPLEIKILSVLGKIYWKIEIELFP